MVDHRTLRSLDQRAGRFQCFAANIRVADAVEHNIVRRQRHLGIVVFSDQDMGFEDVVIEERCHRRIATGSRHQKQYPDRRLITAIWRKRGQKAGPKSLLAMPACAGLVAGFGQQIAHAAMDVDGSGRRKAASKCSRA